MVDKNKNNEQNDEFDDEFEFEMEDMFDDELENEEVSDNNEQPLAEPKKNRFPWLITLIIAGILGFFGWRFYQSGTSTEIGPIAPPLPTAQEAPAPFSEDPLDRQLEAIDQPLPPISIAPTLEREDATMQIDKAVSQTKEDLDKSLGSLKKEIDALMKSNTNKINEIEKDLQLSASKIVNVDRSLSLIQQDISKLTQVLKALTEQVNELQAAKQVSNAEAANRARKAGQAAATSKTPHPSQTMTIHAIIPGRVWLRTQDGKTISASEGDMLSQYGKVLKIDAATGTVLTSSGATIR